MTKKSGKQEECRSEEDGERSVKRHNMKGEKGNKGRIEGREFKVEERGGRRIMERERN